MARSPSRRTGYLRWHGLSQGVAGGRTPHRGALQVEALEGRVLPGDTLLGLAVVARWAFASPSWTVLAAVLPEGAEPAPRTGLGADADLTAALTGRAGSNHSPRQEPDPWSANARLVRDVVFRVVEPLPPDRPREQTHAAALPGAGPDRAESSAGLFPVAAALGPTSLGSGRGRQEGGEASAVPLVGSDAFSRPAALGVEGAAGLSFAASGGRLTIGVAGGPHTVRADVDADGFVDLTLDGQGHTSNPGSASFDSALAGASATTLTGIRFDGRGDDTLILGSGQVPGGLTVQAGGATVVTESLAAAGPLAIQAANIIVSGTLQASHVELAAAHGVDVQAEGRIQAAPAAAGSSIAVSTQTFVNSGQVHADGLSGGRITVQAEQILNAGPITADASGRRGSGGEVEVAFTQSYLATAAAAVSVSNAAGPAGQLMIDGGSTGRLYTSGRQSATGSAGGSIALRGREVVLVGATVDASGAAGGGTVRIGSDVPDRAAAVRNAQAVTVTGATTLRADALGQGNGGRVIVRTGGNTTFAGTVTARGGPAGGAGGQIEVSGRGNLAYAGTADASAAAGRAGTLLLDPKNLLISDAPEGLFPQYDLIDPHPTPGGAFGTLVQLLDNGNLIVTDPRDNFGAAQAGAVYLFNRHTGSLQSALVGSSDNDAVGSEGVTVLSNGNYLVQSPHWNSDRGAVTWGDGTTGLSGTVSASNSLVGSNPGDQVGHSALGVAVAVLSNGNYVVKSTYWNNKRGAVTWGNGSTGVAGVVSEANSLVGSSPSDWIGWGGVQALPSGNYVVSSPLWSANRGASTWGNGDTGVAGVVSEANSLIGAGPGDQTGGGRALSNGNYLVRSGYGGRGSVTWASGTQGVTGVVSEANSLVGTTPGDQVGRSSGDALLPLSNGNYLVESPFWNGGRGAVTWADGSMGITGQISEANSLVGSSDTDRVGATSLTILSNGNYVVYSPYWNGGRGSATWGSNIRGVRGAISEANSLVGTSRGDYVGYAVPLSNGNYVLNNSFWGGGRGAVTWADGTRPSSGVVSASNSLVGTNPSDQVGSYQADGVLPLNNGNYVVQSPQWNGNRGAATWASGTEGVTGVIAAVNSLVGSKPGDTVGLVTPLANGNYVAVSPSWDGSRGAATWASGTAGLAGVVSEANSLVGSWSGDGDSARVVALTNGNYVVSYPSWNDFRGAAIWASGTQPTSAVVSTANSLVGERPHDAVGGIYPFPWNGGFLLALSNGNYVVGSPDWNGGRGAATWGSGTAGVSGVVSAANSLVGGAANDEVGSGLYEDRRLVVQGGLSLANGNYVVFSPYWSHNQGAVTWGSASQGVQGVVAAANSFVGTGADRIFVPLSDGNYLIRNRFWNSGHGASTWVNGSTGQTTDGVNGFTTRNGLQGHQPQAYFSVVAEDPVDHTLLATSPSDDGSGRVTLGMPDPNQLVFDRALSQTLPITPTVLTQTLATGTAVVLQASNDITVSSPIRVHAGGQGGALTLQAGRGILLNASITTDNGALTVIANAERVSGVIDAQRDAGQAVITMAPGTSLDTGSAALWVSLRDGTGLSHSDSRAITLQTVTAGAVAVRNLGPSAGSDVILGAVTSSGPQSYANPQGMTTVTGNLSAGGQPITFDDAVALNPGGTLASGFNSVIFTGGIVAPGAGVVTVAGGVVFGLASTFTVTLNGSGPGSFSQLLASGPIALGHSTLSLVFGIEPPVGSSFEILTNTGSGAILGTFQGLEEGAVFSQGGYQFLITYQGGTGSASVVLTRLG